MTKDFIISIITAMKTAENILLTHMAFLNDDEAEKLMEQTTDIQEPCLKPILALIPENKHDKFVDGFIDYLCDNEITIEEIIEYVLKYVVI